jgi:putative methyltransferase (TIGR04325 family)
VGTNAMSAAGLLNDLAPPLLRRLARRWRGSGLRFSGQPASWAEARAACGGYDAAAILDRVATATRAVIAGEAVFERDSVLFHKPAYPYPVLTTLLRAAALNGGRLDVVDFGGSLGSTWRQCRPFLAGLAALRWQVVEQAAFVALGRAEFTTAELSFAASLDELAPSATAPVIVLSSVMQYLEDPAATLAALSALHASHLVIDRTPLSAEAAARLCIQHAPRQVYDASYPCWILSREALLAQLAPHWRLLSEFPCDEGHHATDDGFAFEFRGLILGRRT